MASDEYAEVGCDAVLVYTQKSNTAREEQEASLRHDTLAVTGAANVGFNTSEDTLVQGTTSLADVKRACRAGWN